MEFYVQDMQSLKQAVDELCAYLNGEGVGRERIFDSRLVANELLGNVLKHAQATASMSFFVCEGHIHITVSSSKSFTPPLKSVCSDTSAEHGRGLFLVDSVCVERTTTQDGGIAVRIKIK
jgi:anti-sigma regulatory factor (Ser/Thr protein kinase)